MSHVQHGERVKLWMKKGMQKAQRQNKSQRRLDKRRYLMTYCDCKNKRVLHRMKGKWWHCMNCGDLKEVTEWEK